MHVIIKTFTGSCEMDITVDEKENMSGNFFLFYFIVYTCNTAIQCFSFLKTLFFIDEQIWKKEWIVIHGHL